MCPAIAFIISRSLVSALAAFDSVETLGKFWDLHLGMFDVETLD